MTLETTVKYNNLFKIYSKTSIDKKQKTSQKIKLAK